MKAVGWTKTGSLDTMRLPHLSSRQGVGHAIVAPAHLEMAADPLAGLL